MNIGVARDTSIKELNDFMANHREQFQIQTYLSRYVEQSAKKLIKGRIDAFLFTKNTTLYELEKLELNNKIRKAGCVSRENIFIAFTPTQSKSDKIKKLINKFEKEMPSLISSGIYASILKKYNIVINDQ